MLLKLSKKVFLSLSLTDEQAKAIELATRSQRQSSDWYSQRQGRNTASLFHDVYTFKEKNCPDSLLKRLLLTMDISHIPAIKRGIEKEDIARREYIAKSVFAVDKELWRLSALIQVKVLTHQSCTN